MTKVLVVDDSAFTRGIHTRILKENGYDVVEATGGVEALTMYASEKPDAVLLDLLMPDMDGMDVVRQLRASDPEAKVIICSTDKQKARREEGREAGVMGFVTKPVDPEELIRQLKQLA